MCQLFALSASAPSTVTFSFTGFSARGGGTADHADGFGLAFHEGASCRLFVDDHRASDSALADFLRRHPIHARTVLAHIRKATQGSVELSNCHPFVREWQGRHWSFCHNGDLKGFRPRLGGAYRPVGQTDSEHAFCWMLQGLRKYFPGQRPAGWRRVAPVLAELAHEVSRHGSFNFLLSDGEALYAHGSTRLHWLQRRHPFVTAHLVDQDLSLDLSLANAEDDRMVLIATEGLTSNEPWTVFEAGELLVFVAGEPVWSSSASDYRGIQPWNGLCPNWRFGDSQDVSPQPFMAAATVSISASQPPPTLSPYVPPSDAAGAGREVGPHPKRIELRSGNLRTAP